jgi:hypothetical protein
MDYVYVLIGLFVVFIVLFERDLLAEPATFKIIFGASSAMFLAGLVVLYTERGKFSMSGALLYPLISLGLYRLSRWYFMRRFNREPQDTFMHWSQGMAEDRLFNISYFVAAFWLLMLLVSVMGKLAEQAGK